MLPHYPVPIEQSVIYQFSLHILYIKEAYGTRLIVRLCFIRFRLFVYTQIFCGSRPLMAVAIDCQSNEHRYF